MFIFLAKKKNKETGNKKFRYIGKGKKMRKRILLKRAP